jgi:hypothetical protein
MGGLVVFFYFWIEGLDWIGGGRRFREGWGDWGVVGEMVTLGERSPCGIYGMFGFLVL